MPSTFVVTTAKDDGPGSLRQAILDANADRGPNTITFAIDPGGPQLITPQSELPASTTPVVIDGATQPGFCGSPLIELDGSLLGRTANGLTLRAGDSTVRGLVVHSFAGAGILLADNGHDTVAGNFLGTDLSGTQALGNGIGVQIRMGASGLGFNRIGGPGDGNVISGNGYGILLDTVSAGDNRIEGNYIGTDVTGTAPLGNRVGVEDAASFGFGDRPGGLDPGTGNVISGNGIGVSLGDSPMTVQGNLIGTDVTGTCPLGNATGVSLLGAPRSHVISANVISANTIFAVVLTYLTDEGGDNVVTGNYIGTDVTGVNPLGNGADGVCIDGRVPERFGDRVTGNVIAYNGGRGVAVSAVWGERITGNAIWGNGGLGIELTNGGNRNQEFPETATATSDGQSATVTGTLTSAANTTFTLEFFANSACDPSGYGQGEMPLGTIEVRTDADGTADFTVSFDGVDVGAFITATATGPQGNTSEFSACGAVTAPEHARPQTEHGRRPAAAPGLALGEPTPQLTCPDPAGGPAVNRSSDSWDRDGNGQPVILEGTDFALPRAADHSRKALHPHDTSTARAEFPALDEVLRELAR